MFRQRQLPRRRVRTHQVPNQIEVCFEDRLTRVSWIRDRSRVRLTNKRSSASQNSPRLRSRSQTKAVNEKSGSVLVFFPCVFSTAKRLGPPAQRCRFGYVGSTNNLNNSTATRLHPPAQRWRFGYVGSTNNLITSTAKRLRPPAQRCRFGYVG